jgi:hypothetical protein
LQADQQTEKQPAEKEPIDEPDFGGDEIFRDNDRHRKREEAPTLAKPKSGNGGNSDSDNDSDNDNSDEQQESVVSAASSTPSPEASPGESETKSQSSDAPTTTTAAAEAPATANEEEEKEQGSEEHPGMAGFLHWYEVETSLYRIYTLERKDPTIPAIPPYVIGSHRGRVPVELVVTNTTTRKINVSWVDYKGKHVPKGQIQRNHGVWKQTTWIDHRESYFIWLGFAAVVADNQKPLTYIFALFTTTSNPIPAVVLPWLISSSSYSPPDSLGI